MISLGTVSRLNALSINGENYKDEVGPSSLSTRSLCSLVDGGQLPAAAYRVDATLTSASSDTTTVKSRNCTN